MKTLLIMLLAVSACMAEQHKYEARKKNHAVHTKYFNNLSKVKLTKIVITKVHFSEAIFYLSKGAEAKRKTGYFDFGISYPMEIGDASNNPFTESPEEKKKYDTLVSLKKSGMSIMDAVDVICKQAGYVWSVDFDEKGKAWVTIEYAKK
ncbi:hypothetical protein JO972_16415 [Verrucomicrobiaceae bacterium 5K15]|uniref:Uncharacterized protein n=1 Tax=Oceaniferula flava TaxID=2800421 RepID=A0AAE2SHA8_9BACT|nr:hypothetical protein [Oceaniferula flavus]MBK1856555.1 hypothetical protein [Oceaniferula flavus]MBM1137862.1 hypothetical protein [Oceaniferula flavus]